MYEPPCSKDNILADWWETKIKCFSVAGFIWQLQTEVQGQGGLMHSFVESFLITSTRLNIELCTFQKFF